MDVINNGWSIKWVRFAKWSWFWNIQNTIRSLLTSERERLIDVVKSKFNKATSNIGLDESLNLAI